MSNDWKEIQQRKMNVSRQSTEMSSLRDDIKRIRKEIDHELTKRVAAQDSPRANGKPCFYCAETISSKAKVCPKCKRVFLESAMDVFQMEKKILEIIRNEEM